MSGEFVLGALALAIALVSIALRWLETPPELSRRMNKLEIDLEETTAQVVRWMKRENVRRARDEKEASDSPPAPASIIAGAVDMASRKAALRARARAKGLM
jgi:hypothetical protein